MKKLMLFSADKEQYGRSKNNLKLPQGSRAKITTSTFGFKMKLSRDKLSGS